MMCAEWEGTSLQLAYLDLDVCSAETQEHKHNSEQSNLACWFSSQAYGIKHNTG